MVILGLFALIGLLFTLVFFGMQIGAFNVRGSSQERNTFFFASVASSTSVLAPTPSQPCALYAEKTCEWNRTPEWYVVAGGLEKDAEVIMRVANETGVSPRLIASVVIPEQIRFFTAEREVFKRYFEPLKILGSLSQFSLGVSGIKEETARAIERHANDPQSQFYPGDGMAALIAYTPNSPPLYERLTDPKDHYYSYLYTALYIKEVMAQWERAGFSLANNPEVVATLFNIGFDSSHPNPTPIAAGASIATGGQSYPFGILGGLFYRSDELLALLPR